MTLSVRSGLDLFLKATQLPSGSEIIVSAVNIPDMFRIVEHHGYRSVPVEVDLDRLEPSLDELERAVSPKTKAILIAHLFGSIMDMQPIIEFANRHQLLVIEDCAQSFVGHDYAGHEESDVVLFSFGPIKTATALGGAVVRVHDSSIRKRMQSIQDAYPRQLRTSYIKRLVKYATLKVLSIPSIYGLLTLACDTLNIDYDQWIGNLGHSFSSDQLLSEIRKRPTAGLLQLLARRLRRFNGVDLRNLKRRRRIGQLISRYTSGAHLCYAGYLCRSHYYWVLAVRASNRRGLIARLRSGGFDATGLSSLIKTRRNAIRSQQDEGWLSKTVYLPIDPSMSAAAVRHLSRLLVSDANLLKPAR